MQPVKQNHRGKSREIRWLRISWLFLVTAYLFIYPAQAQDGFNLPTELYVLTDSGIVERYGIGIEGSSVVSPSDQTIIDFRVAPDGNWFAYRTGDGLFKRNMFTGETERILPPEQSLAPYAPAAAATMAWSPRSDALAYTLPAGGMVYFFNDEVFSRLDTPSLRALSWSPDGGFLYARADEGVFWVWRREDTSMVLTAAIPGAFDAAWLSDTQLLFAPLTGGVTLLDLQNRNQQTPLLSAERDYRLLNVLAPNVVRLFAGSEGRGLLVELDPTVPNEVQSLGTESFDLNEIRWSPDGRLLVALRNGALTLIEPTSGNAFNLPIDDARAFDLGPSYPPIVARLPLPAGGTLLAEDIEGSSQLWRLPQNGNEPVILTPAERDVRTYAIAPDGLRMATISGDALWIDALASDEAPIERVALSVPDPAPAWAPDSRTIYYRNAVEDQSGIWRVLYDTGDPELFLIDTEVLQYRRPLPAPQGDRLLVTRGTDLILVNTTTGEEIGLGINGDATWLDRSRFLVSGTVNRATLFGDGLFLVDAGSPQALPVVVLPFIRGFELLDAVVLGDTVRMLTRFTRPGVIRVLEIPLGGGTPDILTEVGYLIEPRLSPEGTTIIGLTFPGGALIVHRLTDEERFLLNQPRQVQEFRWR